MHSLTAFQSNSIHSKASRPAQAPHSRGNSPFGWHMSHWRGTDGEIKKATAMLHLGWTTGQEINLGVIVPWWVWCYGLERPVTWSFTSLYLRFHGDKTENVNQTVAKVLSRTGKSNSPSNFHSTQQTEVRNIKPVTKHERKSNEPKAAVASFLSFFPLVICFQAARV